jgi:AraC-like DNA-binding protein
MKSLVQSFSLKYGDAIFKILDIMMSEMEGQDHVSAHSHRFYEFHFALRGSYTYTVNNRVITLNQNQFLIIPPMVSHIAVCNEESNYSFVSLSLDLSKDEGEGGFFGYFRDVLNRHSEMPIQMTSDFVEKSLRLRHFINGPNYIRNVCALKMLGSEFIYSLFQSLDGYSSACSVRPMMGDVDRSVLLEELINNPSLSLGKIAEELGYSARHTARIIKKTYGCSVSQLRKKISVKITGDDTF